MQLLDTTVRTFYETKVQSEQPIITLGKAGGQEEGTVFGYF